MNHLSSMALIFVAGLGYVAIIEHIYRIARGLNGEDTDFSITQRRGKIRV